MVRPYETHRRVDQMVIIVPHGYDFSREEGGPSSSRVVRQCFTFSRSSSTRVSSFCSVTIGMRWKSPRKAFNE